MDCDGELVHSTVNLKLSALCSPTTPFAQCSPYWVFDSFGLSRSHLLDGVDGAIIDPPPPLSLLVAEEGREISASPWRFNHVNHFQTCQACQAKALTVFGVQKHGYAWSVLTKTIEFFFVFFFLSSFCFSESRPHCQ